MPVRLRLWAGVYQERVVRLEYVRTMAELLLEVLNVPSGRADVVRGWMRPGSVVALACCVLLGPTACRSVYPDSEGSSCVGGVLARPPDPGRPYIYPEFALIYLDGITATYKLSACFYRDLSQPAERAAVTWASLDPTIATVDPARGPETVVKGHRLGRTRVVAVITGIRREVPVTVCNSPGDCPVP